MMARTPNTRCEGLKVMRLAMVLSSISPLFILWAVRGNVLFPDCYFIIFCTLMVVAPNAFLFLRIRTAKKQNDKREITVGTDDDSRNHILVYLFAMLLPLYSVDLGTWRNLGAWFVALAFIVFLFWHLNLHYMNLLFAARRYRVFTVYPPADDNPFTNRAPLILITRRVSLAPGGQFVAYRLSDTVYLEVEE